MNRWEGTKPNCVESPPLVHDVVRCFLFFNGGVAYPHTSLELYLTFYSKTKLVKIKGTLLVRNTRESKIYLT